MGRCAAGPGCYQDATEVTACWVYAGLLLLVPRTDIAQSKIVMRDAAGMVKGLPPAETNFSK